MGITLLGELLFRRETGPLFEVREICPLALKEKIDSLIMLTTSDPEVYPEPKEIASPADTLSLEIP